MSKLGYIIKAVETMVNKDDIPKKRPKTMEEASPKMSDSGKPSKPPKKDYTLWEDGSYKMSDYV